MLTERQREVLERLDRRVPIKVIASDLGVSSSRINQHIAALKQRTGARDLSELIALYREGKTGDDIPPLRKDAWAKNQLPDGHDAGPSELRATERELALSDVDTFPVEAPWERVSEPTAAPGKLDNGHVVLGRLAMMVGIALGIVGATLLIIAAATTLGRLLDDVAEIPVQETGMAG